MATQTCCHQPFRGIPPMWRQWDRTAGRCVWWGSAAWGVVAGRWCAPAMCGVWGVGVVVGGVVGVGVRGGGVECNGRHSPPTGGRCAPPLFAFRDRLPVQLRLPSSAGWQKISGLLPKKRCWPSPCSSNDRKPECGTLIITCAAVRPDIARVFTKPRVASCSASAHARDPALSGFHRGVGPFWSALTTSAWPA